MTGKHIIIDARIRRSSTGRYIDRLLDQLQIIDRENTYTVLLEPTDPWIPRAANFRRQTIPFKQFSFNPIDQIRYTYLLHKLKPDLVHFSMTQQPIFYFGNIVTTTHDLTMLRFLRAGKTPLPVFWVKSIGYRFLLWWGHRKSTFILTPSKFVAQDMVRFQPFAKNKVKAIPLASEPPLAVGAKQPKNVENPFIFYVGTAFPHKNLEKLVEAFEILQTSQPELKLVLAGKKEHYYEELEKLASKSPVRENIVFTGFVSDAELKWLYENAQAYVFPSLSEGFGLPGLEAMVHGCPVISSNATCLPEVYGDAAIYFDPTNPQDMADNILKVIVDNKLRDELIAKGHTQAKKYSWRQMAQQTLEVYQQALKD